MNPLPTWMNRARRRSPKSFAGCMKSGRWGIVAVDHRLDHWLQVADTLCVMENGAPSPKRPPMDHPAGQ